MEKKYQKYSRKIIRSMMRAEAKHKKVKESRYVRSAWKKFKKYRSRSIYNYKASKAVHG